MKAKKFMLIAAAVCAAILCAGTSFAYVTKIGVLAKLNFTEEEFNNFSKSNSFGQISRIFITAQYDVINYVYYDSLLSMQMALDAGDIQEMALPKASAEYVMKVNDNYNVASIGYSTPDQHFSLSLGFRKSDDPALLNKFNDALKAMKADGTLAVLKEKYIEEAGTAEPEAVKFETFEGAETVKVAVTGDLPPIDYVAADGKPAGFNTAVLSEIAKRIKVNVELLNIDSSARAASLVSGRSDVVFWFMSVRGVARQTDIPANIALSESYYTWNEMLHLKKK